MRELTLGERSFMANITIFRAEDGAALGRVLTLSDISEVRRMAMEKQRFIRTMVHELKSPLGAIQGLLEVVLDKSLGDELDLYLPMLERASARIDAQVGLISELLTLARSEQPGEAAGDEQADAGAAALAAAQPARERGARRGIGVEVQVQPGLPPVGMSAADLELVLSNLVGNAVKYNREGGAVDVSCRREDGAVRIDVADTGIGIRAENRDNVLGEFFREKRPETRELEGNGLGLAIVKRLVERAGGRLELTSAEGVGSTFSVVLPV